MSTGSVDNSWVPFAAMGARRRVGVVAVLAATMSIAGACAPDDARPDLVQVTSSTTTTTTTTVPPARAIGQAPASVPVRVLSGPSPTAFQTIVATAEVDSVSVHATLDGDVIEELSNPTVSGGPLVFVVEQAGTDWHRVRLPVGPADRVAWVRATDVVLAAHEYRIEIDVDGFELRVFDRTVTVFAAPIGFDPDDLPAPDEPVYITELLASTEPNPVYGTYAYGLSGFADEFETFTGESGQFGIHGTHHVSHTCLPLDLVRGVSGPSAFGLEARAQEGGRVAAEETALGSDAPDGGAVRGSRQRW